MRFLSATERLLAAQRSESRTELIEALDDRSTEVARAAIVRLVELSGPEVAAELRERLWTSDLSLVPDLARALKRLGDTAAVDAAISALSDDHYPRRLAAARALELLADRRAAEPLSAAVHDPVAGVRGAAIDALAELGASEATATACATQLLLEPDAHVRALAVRAIARSSRRPGPLLAPTARDQDHLVRLEVARHLAALPDAAALELITDRELRVREAAAEGAAPHQSGSLAAMLADDPSPDVRRAAAHTLASFGDPQAADPLVSALGDVDALVRAAALIALERLLGRTRTLNRLCAELRAPRADRRRAAVYALARLHAAEVAEEMTPLVEDPDSDVRLALVHTATELGQAPHAIRYLTGDRDQAVRHAAEMWLMRAP